MSKLRMLLKKLKTLSDFFLSIGIRDIYTNSKIYEVFMAHIFNHSIINGHAYTPDAEDEFGNLFEYKHYKVSSSNHTWTFNDFSENTIDHLNSVDNVFFSIIDDTCIIPQMIATYMVPGYEVSRYLSTATLGICNKRKMINISEHQIINNMTYSLQKSFNYTPCNELEDIFSTAYEVEKLVNVSGILTSNKLWELLVGIELNHMINSDQKKHDAIDEYGNTYEYKVSSKINWTFQDITNSVLNSYLKDESIILAVVDKKEFEVKAICACNPEAIVSILKLKLKKKREQTKEIRRLSAGIGINDIRNMIKNGDAKWVL